MTDPDDQPSQKPDWYWRLPELDARLRAAKIAHSPDRWLNAHDLLLQRLNSANEPKDAQQLADCLAPLFCRNAQEQKQFRQQVTAWWQSVAPDAEASSPPQQNNKPEPQIAPIPTPKAWPYLLMASVFLALLYGGIYQLNRLPTEPPATPTEQSPVQPAPPITEQGASALLAINPLPPRTPAEPKTLSDNYKAQLKTAGDLIFWWPLPLVLAWMLWRKRRRQVALNKRRDDPNNPLKVLRLKDEQDGLFDGPEVREALKRLHRPSYYPSRRLHQRRTVEQSVRSAGLYSPHYREQARVPEILLWVDLQHSADPLAGLAQTLVQRLRQNGLLVSPVRSYGSPDRLYDETQQRWTNLTELSSRHGDARLLLVGESRLLLDGWTGRPYPWVAHLDHWPQRLLLSPQAEPYQRLAPLAETGLLLAPLTSQGLSSIAQLFTQQAAKRQGQRMLPNLLREAERWRMPIAPAEEDLAALFGVLKRYLGERGQQLLAAMAVYPQIHWGLMRALDLQLWPSELEARRESRLLRLASLPWVRSGWLPEWARRRLIDTQTLKQQAHIGQIYRQLFSNLARQGQAGIELPMRLEKRSALKRWVSDLLHSAPDSPIANDQIFASLIHGGLRRKLAFLLPKTAASYLLKNGLTGHWRGQVIVLLLTLLLGWALQGLWQWQAQQRYGEQALFNVQAEAFSNIPVNITSTPETTALAAALAEQLNAHGFKQLSPAFFDPAPIAPDSQPSVPHTLFPSAEIVAPAALLAEARFIGQRIDYLAHQLPVNLQSNGLPGEGIQVVFKNQATPAGEWGFRDELNQPVDKAQWQQRVAETRAKAEQAAAATAKRQKDKEDADKAAKVAAKRQKDKEGANKAAAKAAKQKENAVKVAAKRKKDAAVGAQTPTQKIAPTDFIAPEMVVLQGGTFKMGCVSGVACYDDELPVHEVKIKAFAMAKNEVTFAEYDLFAEATGREKPDDEGWGRGQRPVINVSWRDAVAYAQWLSEQSGKAYRLPTEAEWEYAARAGTATPFSSGDCVHTDQANYDGNVDFKNCGAKTGRYRSQTVPVDALDAANPWGLRHMHGNVWEWTEDCWHGNYEAAPSEGRAWLEKNDGDCARRVVRGGGWLFEPENLRSADRYRNWPDVAISILGFRLARTL